MKATRPISVLAIAAGFLSACTSRESAPPQSPMAAADTDPHARGLREPTAEERARMEALAKKNPPLTPNELARERLNAERKAQGLPPLPAEPVSPPPSAPAK